MAILKRLNTYEPPQPPPPVPPRSPLHTPHLQDKTLVDPDAVLYQVQRFTGTVNLIVPVRDVSVCEAYVATLVSIFGVV